MWQRAGRARNLAGHAWCGVDCHTWQSRERRHVAKRSCTRQNMSRSNGGRLSISEIIQEVKAGGASGALSERESSLVEDDMARDEHSVGVEVKAAVSLMMS